jgi:predicted metal-dependent peptidase
MQYAHKTTAQPIDIGRLQDRLTKAHVKLISHPETTLYAGVFVMGRSEIVEGLPTAATDGINCFYGAEFISKQNDAQLRFVVMHEKGHIFLRHLPRHREYWKEDAKLANCAADYVINGLIMSLNDKTLCEMPSCGALYDPKYVNWSFGEVYRDLKDKQEKGGGGDIGQPLDEHDLSKIDELSPEQVKEITNRIEQAIQQGGMLAGKLGQKVPRNVADSLVQKVDWADVMREFVSTQTQGRDDDVSLRRLDRRWLTMDIIMPTTIAETVGEIVFAFDTSGSINDEQIADGAAEIKALVESVQPEKVRVLWWDHMVHTEQVFTPDQYGSIANLLRPEGGGGTYVSSVSKHIREAGIKPECVVVFTDGYVESEIDWDGMPPTLWVVTRRKSFDPPVGRVVEYNND